MVVGSGLLLGFIVTNFWPSGSHPAARAKSVSLLDVSGQPLNSVFEGVSADPLYPEFKRLSEKRLLSCDRRSSSWSRFRAMLGLSFESVVHAQSNCGGCGYRVIYTSNCSSDCKGEPYDGYLDNADPNYGTTTGSLVCQTSASSCPGVAPTVNCVCGGGTGGCTPSFQSCFLDSDCCSGVCDSSDFFCH